MKKHSIGLYKQNNRVNKLLPWDLAIFLKKIEMHTGFQILRCTKFDIPNSSGNNKSPVFIWAWSSIFISETVVMQISQLFMFQATHTWFIVAQVMSFGEWLSIIARSELGSDLDCSVINARSELGSDLDCYELKLFISIKTGFCYYKGRKNVTSEITSSGLSIS